jgi:hypothetical protein
MQSIRISSLAIALTFAMAAQANANGLSFILSGKDVRAVETAFGVSKISGTNETAPDLLRNYTVQIYSDPTNIEVDFLPTAGGTPVYVEIQGGNAEVVAEPHDNGWQSPVLLPGVSAGEVLAILKYAQAEDSLHDQSWFVNENYQMVGTITPRGLIAVFFPSPNFQRKPSKMKCLAGNCSGSYGYRLTFTGDAYAIAPIVNL